MNGYSCHDAGYRDGLAAREPAYVMGDGVADWDAYCRGYVMGTRDRAVAAGYARRLVNGLRDVHCGIVETGTAKSLLSDVAAWRKDREAEYEVEAATGYFSSSDAMFNSDDDGLTLLDTACDLLAKIVGSDAS